MLKDLILSLFKNNMALTIKILCVNINTTLNKFLFWIIAVNEKVVTTFKRNENVLILKNICFSRFNTVFSQNVINSKLLNNYKNYDTNGFYV